MDSGKPSSSLGSFPTSPPLYPHFNRPSGFWPCVKSCLVGGSDKYWHALGLAPLQPQRTVPADSNSSGGAWIIACCQRRLFLGECPRHFGSYQVCLGHAPAPGSTFKKALYRTRPFDRARDTYNVDKDGEQTDTLKLWYEGTLIERVTFLCTFCFREVL